VKSLYFGGVHDRLDESAATLSVGQNQRLCIARALAANPALSWVVFTRPDSLRLRIYQGPNRLVQPRFLLQDLARSIIEH